MEKHLLDIRFSGLEYQSWTTDLYKDYCDALFYIRFEECSKMYYKAFAEESSDFFRNLFDEMNWDKINSQTLFPTLPKSFNSLPILIGDNESKNLIETIKKVG